MSRGSFMRAIVARRSGGSERILLPAQRERPLGAAEAELRLRVDPPGPLDGVSRLAERAPEVNRVSAHRDARLDRADAEAAKRLADVGLAERHGFARDLAIDARLGGDAH